jgi:murein DD-endopeptidase MepM/ murein hydrolase activator NlpD
VATRAGKVLARGFEEDGAGYFVSINHGDGFTSTYMHMTHYIVKVNQEVEAGEVIGYMGSTGRSTSSHLHFALSWFDGKNACSQNPADYLPLE